MTDVNTITKRRGFKTGSAREALTWIPKNFRETFGLRVSKDADGNVKGIAMILKPGGPAPEIHSTIKPAEDGIHYIEYSDDREETFSAERLTFYTADRHIEGRTHKIILVISAGSDWSYAVFNL